MKHSAHFQRLVGVTGIFGTFAVLGNVITLFASTRNIADDFFNNPVLLLNIGPNRADIFHWSMVLDLFGYLAFAPIVVFCWLWLKERNKYAMLMSTASGLAYSLLGSVGATVLGTMLPKLINDYAVASATQQATIRIITDSLYRAVAYGVWNPLEVLFVSIWFAGVGFLLRHEKPALGRLCLILSALAVFDPIGWILNNSLIFQIGGGGTVLILVWSLWFGIDLLRGPTQINI